VTKQKCITLLGRRDHPTDAIEEYCHYLGQALVAHDFDLQIVRIDWSERGWLAAFRELRQLAGDLRDVWVFAQYTALAWSSRGFPTRFRRVLKILRHAGAHVAVVYHDVEPFGGQRLIDKVRRHRQVRVMREALHISELAVFTVALEKISWLTTTNPQNVVFVPVGANFLPARKEPEGITHSSPTTPLTIAVFGITGGDAGEQEVQSIAEAVRFVSPEIKNLRLVVLGRNSEAAEKQLRDALRDVVLEIFVMGVLPSGDVARALSTSHVLLFVRGQISTRRGSAIAGIACGLPIVAFAGPETAPPITEAGIQFYSPEKKGDLGAALLRILKDRELRESLAERSRRAQEQYFSWAAIAARYKEALQNNR